MAEVMSNSDRALRLSEAMGALAILLAGADDDDMAMAGQGAAAMLLILADEASRLVPEPAQGAVPDFLAKWTSLVVVHAKEAGNA